MVTVDADRQRSERVRDLLDRGYSFVNSADKSPALGYFDEALAELGSAPAPDLEAQVQNARGIALLFGRELTAALGAFERSADRARLSGVAYLEADAMHNIGFVLHRLDRHVEALGVLDRAVVLLEQEAMTTPLPITWLTIARSNARLGRDERAAEAYDRAVDASERSENDRALAEAAIGRALLLRRLGRLGDAERSLALAIQVRARSGETTSARRLGLRLALWHLGRLRVDRAIVALAGTLRAGR